jgi:hypothetical protein
VTLRARQSVLFEIGCSVRIADWKAVRHRQPSKNRSSLARANVLKQVCHHHAARPNVGWLSVVAIEEYYFWCSIKSRAHLCCKFSVILHCLWTLDCLPDIVAVLLDLLKVLCCSRSVYQLFWVLLRAGIVNRAQDFRID